MYVLLLLLYIDWYYIYTCHAVHSSTCLGLLLELFGHVYVTVTYNYVKTCVVTNLWCDRVASPCV